MNFYENPCSEGQIVACGRKDRQTEMTKLIFTFRTLSAHTVFMYFLWLLQDYFHKQR